MSSSKTGIGTPNLNRLPQLATRSLSIFDSTGDSYLFGIDAPRAAKDGFTYWRTKVSANVSCICDSDTHIAGNPNATYNGELARLP